MQSPTAQQSCKEGLRGVCRVSPQDWKPVQKPPHPLWKSRCSFHLGDVPSRPLGHSGLSQTHSLGAVWVSRVFSPKKEGSLQQGNDPK